MDLVAVSSYHGIYIVVGDVMYPSIGNEEELVLNVAGIKAVDGVAPCRVQVVVAVLAVNNVPCVGVVVLVGSHYNCAFNACQVAEVLYALCIACALESAVAGKAVVDGAVVSRIGLAELVLEDDRIIEYLELGNCSAVVVCLGDDACSCGIDLLLHCLYLVLVGGLEGDDGA